MFCFLHQDLVTTIGGTEKEPFPDSDSLTITYAMADDVQGGSPKTEPSHVETNEDAETRATRRELKQSSISDEIPGSTNPDTTASSQDTSGRPDTPADAQSDDLREQIASPKKKRAHDQLESDKAAEENDANSVASSDSAKDRASRTEPEKKRHRDGESESDSVMNDPCSGPSCL